MVFPLIAGALGAAAIGGSLFGKNEDVPQQTGASGLAAAHPELVNAYITGIIPEAWQQFAGGKYQGTPMGQAPTGPFASQGLQELQNYSNQNGGIFRGGTGVYPLGAVEPFNPYQQNAISQFGQGYGNFLQNQDMYSNPYQQAVLNQLSMGGYGLQQDLPNYMNPWLDQVLNPQLDYLNREAQSAENRLRGRIAGSGNLGGGGSTYEQQLAKIDQTRQQLGSNIIGRETGNAYNQALGQRNNTLSALFQGGGQAYGDANQLRRQSLQDMLNAGNAIQGQGQQQLNALAPQLQQTTPGAKLGQFGQQLNMIPNSSTTTGYTQQPNMWAKIGGAAQQGLGMMAGFGGGMPGMGGGIGNYNVAQSGPLNSMASPTLPWSTGYYGY